MSSSPALSNSRSAAPPGTPTRERLAPAPFGDPSKRTVAIGAGVAVGMLVAMFWPNVQHFVYVWTTDENYSHGFLVPFISLYFAKEAARLGPVAMRPGTALGVALLLASILGRLATVVVPVGFVGDLSFLIGGAGVCSILFGTAALKRYGFAITFLVFMIPLPVALYARIASPLQLGVSQVAAAMLNLSGIPALCEGNMITLPGDNRMFVAEACSGMRQLTGFLALATAWAFLVARPAWYRLVLIVGSIPIAMTANVVRVTLTGMITYYFDPRYASGAYHTAEGILMMGFGLAMLYAGSWTLDRLAGLVRGARPSTTGDDS